MSEAPDKPSLWSNTEAYSVFLICLALGFASGYWLRSPAPHATPPLAPAAVTATESDQVSPEQLRHMAEMRAEPLLKQLKSRPDDAALLAKVGDMYVAVRQFPLAQQYYERAVAAHATDPLLFTHLALCYSYAGDVDRAIDTLHAALRLDSNFGIALFNLGMIEYNAKSNPEAAIKAWETLLRTNPTDPHCAQVERLIAEAKAQGLQSPGLPVRQKSSASRSDTTSQMQH